VLLLIVVPLLVAVAGVAVYLKGGRFVETDNAYVKADKVPVSAEVSGTVLEVAVAENQTVKAGQLLFRLDAAPFRVALAKAEARLAQVRTDLSALRASYREKQAEIAIARTRLAFAVREQRRQADLATKNFISAARLDEAVQGTDLAAQQITALDQDLKRIAASLGGGVDAPVERHPAYLSALAELEQARLDLARTEVRASLPGTVGKPPKPGQYVAAGSTAMALVVSGEPWIEANFTETDLTYVHPGQPVAIHVDTYPNVAWQGVVESLSPATGAEFSVIPAQNATGNWVKITQRLPVRIRLEARPGLPPLRAGLSTTVEIDTGHRRRLFGLSL
jgi:membrane fusion protein (multidrug efflux system)